MVTPARPREGHGLRSGQAEPAGRRSEPGGDRVAPDAGKGPPSARWPTCRPSRSRGDVLTPRIRPLLAGRRALRDADAGSIPSRRPSGRTRRTRYCTTSPPRFRRGRRTCHPELQGLLDTLLAKQPGERGSGARRAIATGPLLQQADPEPPVFYQGDAGASGRALARPRVAIPALLAGRRASTSAIERSSSTTGASGGRATWRCPEIARLTDDGKVRGGVRPGRGGGAVPAGEDAGAGRTAGFVCPFGVDRVGSAGRIGLLEGLLRHRVRVATPRTRRPSRACRSRPSSAGSGSRRTAISRCCWRRRWGDQWPSRSTRPAACLPTWCGCRVGLRPAAAGPGPSERGDDRGRS